MNYILTSRIIYSFPFLIYLCLNYTKIFAIPETFLNLMIWSILFLLSIIFYAISRKILPLLLIQFVFIAETYIYTMLAIDSGIYTFILFVLLSSFYTLEALRNDFLHISIHLFILLCYFYILNGYLNINENNFVLDNITFLILLSPIICRGIMSSLESKDVLLREITKEKSVYVPMEDTNKTNKLQRKIDFFKEKNKDLQLHVSNIEKDKERLTNEYKQAKIEFNKIYNQSQESQRINKEIAHAYFALLENIRFDLSKTFIENIHNIALVFMNITKASYVAIISLESTDDDDDDDDYYTTMNLIDSVKKNGIIFSDDVFLDNDTVKNNLSDTINSANCNYQSSPEEIEGLEPLQNIIYIPISSKKSIKGVLVQGFDKNYKNNIHNFNLSLMVAYHIYTAVQNENLYRKAKDASNIDGLTQIYNKKYLLDNIQAIFNNIYNYETNLACVFVDVDYFKQINDTYGHEKGDYILQTIVNCLQSHIRRSDSLIRYGGDEFIVLLSSVTNDKLIDFCNEVNNKLSLIDEKIIINNESKSISVSMGAMIFNPSSNNVKDGNELISLADKALYQSKANGKGHMYIYQK